MEKSLEDFPEGLKQNRYIPGELPSLPFDEKEFDLALCSHFLFLYTDNLSLEFHQSLKLINCLIDT
jgi:ubiquinone/menaquinone biosynthesis C-methylase UbiE